MKVFLTGFDSAYRFFDSKKEVEGLNRTTILLLYKGKAGHQPAPTAGKIEGMTMIMTR
jgi:hypothetical protein